MNEGYAPKPFASRSLQQSEKRGFRLPPENRPDTTNTGDSSGSADDMTPPTAGVNGATSGPAGESGEALSPDSDNDNDDELSEDMWGSFTTLSVHSSEGMCSGLGADCSRVWMYGSVAWNVLRNRCRLAAAGEGNSSAEAVDVGCAVGSGATALEERVGGLLLPKHVCGAWRPSADGRDRNGWAFVPRVVVWELDDVVTMRISR